MRKITFVFIILCAIIIVSFISGCTERSFARTDTTLVKVNHSGDLQWVSVFENSGYATERSLAPGIVQGITDSDGFFLAGFFTDTTGAGCLRTLKIDESGKLIHETRLPALQDQVLSITRQDDAGYLIISRLGQAYVFNRKGEFGNVRNFSEQLNRGSALQTAGQETLPITLLSVSRSPAGEFSALVMNHADIYHPVQIIWFFPNGTIRKTMIPNQEKISPITSVFPLSDGGLILGKSMYREGTGGGKQGLLERTDNNGTKIWITALGVCNYTSCTNDLRGFFETEPGMFEIIYQSHEQSNSSLSPITTIHIQLDDLGHIWKQETISDVSGLPSWLFQTGSSSDFRSIIPERAIQMLTTKNVPEKNRILSVSVLGTGDGGYALIATRYND